MLKSITRQVSFTTELDYLVPPRSGDYVVLDISDELKYAGKVLNIIHYPHPPQEHKEPLGLVQFNEFTCTDSELQSIRDFFIIVSDISEDAKNPVLALMLAMLGREDEDIYLGDSGNIRCFAELCRVILIVNAGDAADNYIKYNDTILDLHNFIISKKINGCISVTDIVTNWEPLSSIESPILNINSYREVCRDVFSRLSNPVLPEFLK